MNFIFHSLNEIFFRNLFVRKVIKPPAYHEILQIHYLLRAAQYIYRSQ